MESLRFVCGNMHNGFRIVKHILITIATWTSKDVIELKKGGRINKKSSERVFYWPLAQWLKLENPARTLYVDAGSTGIDVISVEPDNWIGYEVKVPTITKSTLDFTPIFNGIGQGLDYLLRRGMDYAYLVCPFPYDADFDLPNLIKETPLGLITIDKDKKFSRLIKARKTTNQLCSDKVKNEIRSYITEIHKNSRIKF